MSEDNKVDWDQVILVFIGLSFFFFIKIHS